MKYRTMGKLGIKTSAFGLGCMRFNGAASGDSTIDEPVPGLISGGPNKCFPYPQTRDKLGEDVPPARYFLDETPSADTNEIAVYWNSPAVFTGAWANTLTSEKERKQ